MSHVLFVCVCVCSFVCVLVFVCERVLPAGRARQHHPPMAKNNTADRIVHITPKGAPRPSRKRDMEGDREKEEDKEK